MEFEDNTLSQYQNQNEELNRKIDKFMSMSYEEKLKTVESRFGGGKDIDIFDIVKNDQMSEFMLAQKELKIMIEEMEKKSESFKGENYVERKLQYFKDMSQTCDNWLNLKEQKETITSEERNDILNQINENSEKYNKKLYEIDENKIKEKLEKKIVPEDINKAIEEFKGLSYRDKFLKLTNDIIPEMNGPFGTDYYIKNILETNKFDNQFKVTEKEIELLIQEMNKGDKAYFGKVTPNLYLKYFESTLKMYNRIENLKERNEPILKEEIEEILHQNGENERRRHSEAYNLNIRKKNGYEDKKGELVYTEEQLKEENEIEKELKEFEKLTIGEKQEKIQEWMFTKEQKNIFKQYDNILETKDATGMKDLKLVQREIELYCKEYEQLSEDKKKELTQPEYQQYISDKGELFKSTIYYKEKFGELLPEEQKEFKAQNNEIIRKYHAELEIREIKERNKEQNKTNKENDNKSVAQNSAFSNIFKGFSGVSALGIAKGMNQYVNNYKSELNTYIDKVRKDKNSKEETTILAKTNNKDDKTKDTDQDRI